MTPPTTTTSYVVYEGNHPILLEKKEEEKAAAITQYIEGLTIHEISRKTKYLSIKEIREIIRESGHLRPKGVQTSHNKRIIHSTIYQEFCEGTLKGELSKKYQLCSVTVSKAVQNYPYNYQVNREGYFKRVSNHNGRGNNKYSAITLFDLNKAYQLHVEGYMWKDIREVLKTYPNTLTHWYKDLVSGKLEDAYRAYNEYHGPLPYPLNEGEDANSGSN